MWQADLLEDFQDQLEVRVTHWMMDHAMQPGFDDKLRVIHEFVEWSRIETTAALHAKRGKDGLSFVERRDRAIQD